MTFIDEYINQSFGGLLFDDKTEYEDLISALNNVLPKNTHIYNNIGLAYMESGYEGMALPALLNAIEINPNNDIAYINIARFHLFYTKNHSLVEQNYTKAIELQPMNSGYYFMRADLYLYQYKNAELAYKEYKISYTLNPENALVLSRIKELEIKLAIKQEDRVIVKQNFRD